MSTARRLYHDLLQPDEQTTPDKEEDHQLPTAEEGMMRGSKTSTRDALAEPK